MTPSNFTKVRALLLAAGTALSLSACATVPGGGVAAGAPITQAESQQGAQYHDQFVAEFGGAMTGPQADYVAQVGRKVSVQSGLAANESAFKVTLLNSPVYNAFAVPGGYVYVTRQLVALMNSEAELAAVLGHEVGHVSARHSARRQQTAQRNEILGVLGQVLSGVLLGDSQLGRLGQQVASTAPQLATLSYSREQETEADGLGVTYLRGSGYDPRAMSTVLNSLAAQNSLDAQLQGRGDASVPAWASTHPDPASRVRNAATLAGTPPPGAIANRDVFLSRIDGLLYGDDPQQGVVEGQLFIHPVLRFQFTAPQGFYMTNGTDAVSLSGSAGRAQLKSGRISGNLDTYVRQVFQALGGQQQPNLAPQSVQRTTVNNLPAAYGTARVTSGQSQLDVTVFAYDFGEGNGYYFVAIAPAGGSAAFNPLFNSMRRITAAEAGQVVPRRVSVVTAGPRDTVQTLAGRMAYPDAQEARFRVLNGLSQTQQLVAGQKYKIVVRGR